MATERKIKTTVKKSSGPKQVRDSKSSTSRPAQRSSGGGTLNPGPGKKK